MPFVCHERSCMGDGPNFFWFETIIIKPFSTVQGLTRMQLTTL